MVATLFKWSRRPMALFLLLTLLVAIGVHGQAVSNPNQIVGTIEFTNTDPVILGILNSPGGNQGFHLVRVTARSVVPPPLSNLTTFASASQTSTPYEITVESGPPGAGIPYVLSVLMFLDQKDAGQGQDQYFFDRIITDPVVEEDAPDVVADLRECAGLLDVRWETPDGSPATVDGGVILAFREVTPGTGSFIAKGYDPVINAGSGQEYLAVEGDGSLYRVVVSYVIGLDPWSDQIRYLHQEFIEVGCDEIVEIVAPVPEGGPGGELGEVVGELDMLGEIENRLLDFSLMEALSGPAGNFRFDTVDVPAPSQGLFELSNLVPSDIAAPPIGYRVHGNFSLRGGNRHEYFRTPTLGDDNGRVFVSAGGLPRSHSRHRLLHRERL